MSTSEALAPSTELNGSSIGINGYVDPTHESNGLPPAQPGSSKTSAPQQVNGSKVVMDYVTDFPELPGAKLQSAVNITSATTYRPLIRAIVTETLKLSAAERAAMNLGNQVIIYY
jgi:hypothetical protein